MNSTLLSPTISRSSYILLIVFMIASVLSAVTYWQFAQYTGCMLVFGQGVLQLIVAMLLLVLWIKPARKWQLLAQFLNSFFVFLLCGLLINESYIRWQEGGTVVTSAALITTLLGFGALVLLCHLLNRLSEGPEHLSTHRLTSSILPKLSGVLSLVLLITHLTGWVWLDIVAAFLTASALGVVALFFLIDGYWNIMEVDV
ncbi:MAG: hypothetical protein AAFP77_30110 [Bacteroidota bacterium]